MKGSSKIIASILSMFLLSSCSIQWDAGKRKDNNSYQITDNEEDDASKGTNSDAGNNDEDEDVTYTYNYYEEDGSFTSGAAKLSFNAAGNLRYLQGLEGKKVALKGFMLTGSPVDGSFVFLTNMPYQSCPFCNLNTSELTNCFEIYPKSGDKFLYTSSAIVIVGTLKVAETKSKLFVDKFGYELYSLIEDAEYKILKDEDIQGDFALRNKFASGTLLNELYDMLNYVNFTCKWNTYYVPEYERANGEMGGGYYIFANDAKAYITDPNGQFYYGYATGYFEDIIAKVKAISDTDFEPLVNIIKDSKSTSEYAISELMAGHYTYERKYLEMFNKEDYYFTITDKSLETAPTKLFDRFSNWLTSFEM